MKLYIMRHGQAQISAPSDSQRALTPLGQEQTAIMAKWLRNTASSFDVAFVSPYKRALQTFDIVSQQVRMSGHHYCLEELTPESNPSTCGDALLAYCAEHKATNAFAVSHLPLVGLVINDLCRGDFVPAFTTSSIACLDIDLVEWQGRLLWHRTLDDVLMGA